MARSLVSPRLRKVVLSTFTHTYTLQIKGTGSLDAWNIPSSVNEEQVLNLKCLFMFEERALISELGKIVTRTPVMYVEYDSLAKIGDIVKNIKDIEGNKLVDQDLEIVTAVNEASGGLAVMKKLSLVGAKSF